jgi:catechol 2,3-dioxygenase-like lactoylglutathione lyase family enzyme
MAPFTFYYTGIRVRNLERSIEFYTEVLGMRVDFLMKIRRQHGEVAVLKSPRGTQKLELNWYEPGSKYATPFVKGGALDHLAFRTGSLSRAEAEFRRKGVTIVDRYLGPRGGEWFYIADPDGNWIEINGPR